MSDTDSSVDSDELEALFDSVADKVWGASVEKRASAEAAEGSNAKANDAPDETVANMARPSAQREVKDQVRHIATLFNTPEGREDVISEDDIASVREMVSHTSASGRVSALKAAMDPLRQTAELAEQLSHKIRKTIETLDLLCDDLGSRAASLAVQWDLLYANKISVDEFKRLASETCAYLKNGVPQTIVKTREQAHDTAPLQDSVALVSLLAKNALSHLEEFEMHLTDTPRKAEN